MTGKLTATTYSAPTDAHLLQISLLAQVALGVAHRRADVLPGLLEVLQDDVLFTAGQMPRFALGAFEKNAWQLEDRRVHEVIVSADRRWVRRDVTAAEDVLVTLLHECCHVYAQANDVQDTSRDGRYHNARFGQIAHQIGLTVERDRTIGIVTPSLKSWAMTEYADLVEQLQEGLGLARAPQRPVLGSDQRDHLVGSDTDGDQGEASSAGGSDNGPKYIFATCNCPGSRGHNITIRIAGGSWHAQTIRCVTCDAWFVESPSTSLGPAPARRPR